MTFVASIPSPSDGTIGVGPAQLRAYGVMIALGVVAGVWLARRRAADRSVDPDIISTAATWGVPAGLVGARAYHVLTDYQRYTGRWLDALKIWEGGLGIPGGLVVGVAVGAYAAHRRGLPPRDALDIAVPAIPLAQAIGRVGNWFNQELYGRATSLPWSLEIDREHRPDGMLDQATYHPTFLYEALWNLALVAVLVRIDRGRVLPRGALVWCYLVGYGLGRLWVEALRIDPASLVLGVRINIWVSVLAVAAGTVGLLVHRHAAAPQ